MTRSSDARGGRTSRPRLLAAVRDRMRSRVVAPDHEARPAPAPARPAPPSRDLELEQLQAEARYHRERFDLYEARVVSGSVHATSATRLRELKRTAVAAAERLAHARKTRRS